MELIQPTSRWSVPVRALQALLAAAVVLVMVLGDPLGGGLQIGAYVLCAVLAVLRPCLSRVDRLLWTLVAGAIVLRSVGFVVYVPLVRAAGLVPYPSAADVLWLLMSLVLLAALAERLRPLTPRLALALVLDSVLGALTAAAVAVGFLYGEGGRLPDAGTSTVTVLTNLAYPVLDAGLLVLVMSLVVASRWSLPPSDLLLGLGVLLIAVLDAVFLYQVGQGAIRPDDVVMALSLLATAILVLSVWSGPDHPVPPVDTSQQPGVALPAVLATVCVGTFVYASLGHVPAAAAVLTAGGLLVAIVRAVLTIVRDRAAALSVLGRKDEELLRFQALVETSPDFVAIADMDRRVVYVNPAGRKIVGLTANDDLSSIRIEDLLTEDGQRVSSRLEQPTALRSGRWDGESTLRHLGGGPPTPVAVSTFLMRHPRSHSPFGLATVQRDITERLNAERALQDLADQRQVLLGRLVQAQEEERTRIAADVHDDSVQSLAAVDLRLGLLRRRLADSVPEELEDLDRLRETVATATERLRHLLFDLESPAVSLGIVPALTEAAEYVLQDSGASWEVSGGCDTGLSHAARITAYRIAREAIVNAGKHARAQHVIVTVAAVDGGVEVTVVDDGIGFDPDQDHSRPGHLGLSSTRDRAEIAGGRLDVHSVPAEGTTVRLWLPSDDR